MRGDPESGLKYRGRKARKKEAYQAKLQETSKVGKKELPTWIVVLSAMAVNALIVWGVIKITG